MLKFIRNILICVLAVCVALAGFILVGQIIPNQSKNSYYAAMNDKYDALLNRDEPHIIIVGGSNAAFGFDTEAISEAFDMPALNLGLHAGLKRDFSLNMAKSNIIEGDIVILALEYSAYIEDLMSEDITWYVIDNNFEFMKMVPASNIFNIARYYPFFLVKKGMDAVLNPNPIPDNEVYRYQNFDEYGDLKYERYENLHTPDSIKQKANINIGTEYISDESMQSLKEFGEFCRSKGAQVYATWPSIDELAVSSIEGDGTQLEEYYKKNTGIDVISKVKDYILPTEMFYDSNYHLNYNGVEVRTNRLIEDMKAVVK